jgi:hypothetical protein
MESFGIFGFIFGMVGFVMASHSLTQLSQLKKEVDELRNRPPAVRPVV